MLKNIREKIKEVFYKYFGKAESIIKRAKKVAEFSSNTSDKKKDGADKKIEDESLAAHLCSKNSGDSKSVAEGMKALSGVCAVASDANDVVNKGCDTAIDLLEAAEDLESEKLKAAMEAVKKIGDDVARKFQGKESTDSIYPGNKNFALAERISESSPEKTAAGARFVAGTKITVKALAVAEGGDIRTIASFAEDIAQAFIDSRKSIEASDKSYQKLEKAIDKLAKADEKDSKATTAATASTGETPTTSTTTSTTGSTGEQTTVTSEDNGTTSKQDAVKAARAVLGGINAPAKNILTYGLQTAGYAVTYCEKSVAQYEK
jgi:hypothetical protein